MRPFKKLDQSGAALGVVIFFTTMIIFIAAYVLSLGYNQTKQVNAVGTQRTKIYFRSQAGIIDAMWRIRTDTPPPAGPSGSFATASFDPNPYYIDIDHDTYSATEVTDTVDPTKNSDVKVDIGTRNAATSLRSIDSTGLDK